MGRRGDLGAKRDRSRDGARAGSQWERHREEAPPHDLGVGERGRLHSGGRMDVVVFGAVEHAPTCGGQQQAAAEAHDRQRDAEEREDVSAEQHRRDHDEPAVDRDLARQPLRNGAIAAEGCDEHRCRSERIDDRQQGHRHQDQRVQEQDDPRVHEISAAAPQSGRAVLYKEVGMSVKGPGIFSLDTRPSTLVPFGSGQSWAMKGLARFCQTFEPKTPYQAADDRSTCASAGGRRWILKPVNP